MKKIISIFILSILLINVTSAEINIPVQPSSGKKWIQTFNDDFNGTTVDKTKWWGGYAKNLWCGNGTCPEQWTGISVNNGILAMHGTIDRVDYNKSFDYKNRAIMNTGGRTFSEAKFYQRYGYFEASMKYPFTTNGAARGAWFSFWTLPMLKTSNSGVPKSSYAEIDIQEIVLTTSIAHKTQMNIHDNNKSNAKNFVMYPTADLSKDFHRYGMYWKDDGSPHGSVQPYFDGVPQGEPYQLVSPWFDNGIMIILQHISCYRKVDFISGTSCTASSVTDNPVYFDYVRAYKEVPTASVTPIPTITLPQPCVDCIKTSWLDYIIAWFMKLIRVQI